MTHEEIKIIELETRIKTLCDEKAQLVSMIKRKDELLRQEQKSRKNIENWIEIIKNVKVVEPGDKEYPWPIMCLIDDPEQYTLISLNGFLMIPFYLVVDKLLAIRPDEIIRGGRKICPNCGADIEGGK